MMRDLQKEAGFTLVEMAFVVLIMGLIVGSVFAFYSPLAEQKRLQMTTDRQAKIARALADFAERTGTLPCPGRPDGSDADPDDTIGQPRTSCDGADHAQRAGIVPFRVLGLTRDDVTDGYGNPFTYAVAREIVETAAEPVHESCRIAVWYEGGAHQNPSKAHLCCRRINTGNNQLLVFNDRAMTNDDHVVNIQANDNNLNGDFNDTGVMVPGGVISPNGQDDNLAYFAYVLVSHGANGDGAFVWESDTRRAIEFPSHTAERQNNDDDNRFVALPYNKGEGADYFDDVVLWRTQQGLIRELGNNRCNRP